MMGLVGCVTANASHQPLVSDRPDFTESTSTMTPGEVQTEGGYTFSRVAGEKTSTAGELLVRVGITHSAELRIEPGSYAWVSSPTGRESGRQDGEIGAKVRLHNAADDRPSPDPNVSLVLATSVATGTDAFRQSRAEPEVKLAGEWTLTPHVGLGVNLDVARPVDDARRYTELAASASFGFSVSPRIGAFAEAFGFAPEVAGAKHTGYLDTGLTALVSAEFAARRARRLGVQRCRAGLLRGCRRGPTVVTASA